jgi:hypothetical protein
MTLRPAATLVASVASAHSPATEAAPDPVALSATAVLAGPLPHEVRMKGGGWWLDGHPLTGSDEAQTAAVLTLLEHAPGNEERVDRARRRERRALGLALGGLGFESAGLVVAVAAASGVVGVAVGPARPCPSA